MANPPNQDPEARRKAAAGPSDKSQVISAQALREVQRMQEAEAEKQDPARRAELYRAETQTFDKSKSEFDAKKHPAIKVSLIVLAGLGILLIAISFILAGVTWSKSTTIPTTSASPESLATDNQFERLGTNADISLTSDDESYAGSKNRGPQAFDSVSDSSGSPVTDQKAFLESLASFLLGLGAELSMGALLLYYFIDRTEDVEDHKVKRVVLALLVLVFILAFVSYITWPRFASEFFSSVTIEIFGGIVTFAFLDNIIAALGKQHNGGI